MSAPFSKSRKQISLWPLRAALCNAVWPYYNNRERDRERQREMIECIDTIALDDGGHRGTGGGVGEE